MLMGLYKNYEDLEDNLTLEEMQTLIAASREQEHRRNRFQAAIQGIDLSESEERKASFEEVQMRAQAKLSGESVDKIEFDALGIDIDIE